MTVRMGIRELRQNLSAAVRRAERGETIEVTRDGEPVARLTPVTYPTRLDRLIAEGRVRPALRPLDVTRSLREASTGTTASEALQEDRGE
jgi:prevent-host-death family protein